MNLKRKRKLIQKPPLIDTLLSLAPTLEAIETLDDDILAARDFTGVPYHIYTTVHGVRLDLDILHDMLMTRGVHAGRRSFLGMDGRLLAVDIYKAQEPHTLWMPVTRRPLYGEMQSVSLIGNRNPGALASGRGGLNNRYTSLPCDAIQTNTHHPCQPG